MRDAATTIPASAAMPGPAPAMPPAGHHEGCRAPTHPGRTPTDEHGSPLPDPRPDLARHLLRRRHRQGRERLTRPGLLEPASAGLRGRGLGERGSATLELVVVFPVVLLLIFGGVQGALYYHARAVALAAAQEGARAAAVEGATPGAGQAAAVAFIERTGGAEVLPDAQVVASRTATTANVSVTGRSLSVLAIPGVRLDVAQSASVAVERISK